MCPLFYSRFDLTDSEQRKRLQVMDELFRQFGVTSAAAFLTFFLPPAFRPLLEAVTGGKARFKRQFRTFFKFFEEEYEEHERTFDPAHMRDFIDVYLAERQRVAEEGSKDSSFYGSTGRKFASITCLDFGHNFSDFADQLPSD